MPEFLFLRAQIAQRIFRRIDFDRNAFDDVQPRFLERPKFERIVRDDLHLAQTEIVKNLGTLPVVSQIDRQPESFIRFDRISAQVL